jgi:hypothetical protein
LLPWADPLAASSVCPSAYSVTQPAFIQHHCLPGNMLSVGSYEEQNEHSTCLGDSSFVGNMYVNKEEPSSLPFYYLVPFRQWQVLLKIKEMQKNT